MSSETPTYGFGTGFATCLLMFVGIAFVVETLEWLATQPQPQALVQFLTTPMFSPVDVVTGLLVLALLWVLVTVPVWGPRW